MHHTHLDDEGRVVPPHRALIDVQLRPGEGGNVEYAQVVELWEGRKEGRDTRTRRREDRDEGRKGGMKGMKEERMGGGGGVEGRKRRDHGREESQLYMYSSLSSLFLLPCCLVFSSYLSCTVPPSEHIQTVLPPRHHLRHDVRHDGRNMT